MKNHVFVPALIAGLFFSACNQTERSSSRYMEAADNVPTTEVEKTTMSTDVTKMLREADLRFRVKDVQKSTSVLEKLAVSHGGYVARSMYDINESETIIKKISTDSAQEIKQLHQRNHMELFVLNTKLDSFLDRLKPLVDHLEYRHLSATELVATPESDQKSGMDQYNSNIAVNRKFAHVIMDFYQTPITQKWIIPNPDSFEVARGGFWDDFMASLKTGWRGVSIAFNYLISFWPLWMIAGIMWLWMRRIKGRKFSVLFKRA